MHDAGSQQSGTSSGRGGDHKPPGDDVPPPGTTFTGEPITAEHPADLQEEVDEGHEPWRLDQSRVASVFASNRSAGTTSRSPWKTRTPSRSRTPPAGTW
jgi:hypothetical protein